MVYVRHSVGRDKHNRHLEERLSKPEPLAEDADSVTKMKYRLKTPEGKAIYGARAVIPNDR